MSANPLAGVARRMGVSPQVLAAGAAGAVGLGYLGFRRKKTASPAPSVIQPGTANTTASDLWGQLEPQLESLQAQIQALGAQPTTAAQQAAQQQQTQQAAQARSGASAFQGYGTFGPSGLLSGAGVHAPTAPIPGIPADAVNVGIINQPRSGGPTVRWQTGGATAPGTTVGGVLVPAGATPVTDPTTGQQIGWQAGGSTYPLHPVEFQQ